MLLLRNSISIIFIFMLSACLQKPVFNIEVEQPEATVPPVTPFPTETEISVSSPTPLVSGLQLTMTLTPVVWPRDFSPVLYRGNGYGMSLFLLLGGVSTNEWFPPNASVARYGGEATYSLHTLTQISKYLMWGKVPEFSPTCGNYFISTDPGFDEPGFVGVVDGWNVTKRDVVELSTDAHLYQQVVVDWLTAMGVVALPPSSLQAFRVDLEGDGVDEVFISATHLDDSQRTPNAGDYSLVLMRKVVGNDAVTKLVVGDHYNMPQPEMSNPRTFTLANFIDLNQDGVLEVVVEINRKQGFGAIVLQVDGQDVFKRLGAEC